MVNLCAQFGPEDQWDVIDDARTFSCGSYPPAVTPFITQPICDLDIQVHWYGGRSRPPASRTPQITRRLCELQDPQNQSKSRQGQAFGSANPQSTV